METTALMYTRASMDRHYLMRATDDQETDCRAWCDQQGWRVGKVITDANRSASQWRTREREGFEEALQLIASKEYDAFVTWEPSRAGRELLAYVQLRAACQEAGVLYLTRGRVYDFERDDDAFMMGLEFLTAEKDAAVIRERQLRTVPPRRVDRTAACPMDTGGSTTSAREPCSARRSTRRRQRSSSTRWTIF